MGREGRGDPFLWLVIDVAVSWRSGMFTRPTAFDYEHQLRKANLARAAAARRGSEPANKPRLQLLAGPG